MRQLLLIALVQFRLMLRSKGVLVSMILLPLLLTLIFGVMAGKGTGDEDGPVYRLAVVNPDGENVRAMRLLALMSEEPSLSIRVVSEEDLRQLFADKQVDGGVLILPGFGNDAASGEPIGVKLITAPEGNLQAAIRPVVSRLLVMAMRERSGPRIPVEHLPLLAPGETAESAGSSLEASALGFTVMFVMMNVLGMAGVVLQERTNGTLRRLLVGYTSKAGILAGYLLSFVMIGLFQFAVLVGGSTLLFGVRWGPILPLLLVAFAFVLCSASLGLFLAGVARTAEQQRVVGVLVVVATSMLGGVFWPLEFVSKALQRIAYLTPQAWAMDGLRNVVLRGGAWEGIAWPVLTLLGLAVLFLAVGFRRLSHE